MKTSRLYLSMLVLLVVGCQKDKTANSIINSFVAQAELKTSMEYDINYKIKYFSSEKDTLNYFSSCRLIRHKSDSIFGGSFWIKNDSIDRYYDLENIYIIQHDKKSITRFFPHKGQDWIINSRTISGVIDSYFLKPNRFSTYVKDSTIRAVLKKDTIFNENKLQHIQISFADDLPVEKQKKSFYFNGENNLKSISYSAKWKHEQQYNEWHFSNEKYNTVNDKILKSEFDSLVKIYSLEDFKEPDPKLMEPLANGITAPEFQGLNFKTNDSVRLKDFQDKIVLLDFWYKDCPPCIKSIPFFSRLREKYPESKLAILGLNSIDKKEKDEDKLNLFIEDYEMNYPTILIDDKIAEGFNVRAYPTLYIVGESGEFVFSKVGFSEEYGKEIEKVIDSLVKL